MATLTKKVRICRCERCGFDWQPREGNQNPKICPECKTPYWDVPKEQKQ